jgi:outer membrane protein OmpU
MKSKLLATSALVAAGLWGMADVAQAQKVAPITAVVGGYHEQTFGYASNEDGVGGGNLTGGTSNPTGFQQKSDSEIWFGGRTTLANGITIGFDVQLEANSRASDQIDESYLLVDGAFGRFVMGSENAADYIMHYAAPGAGKAYGPLESSAVDWITRPANVVFIDTTAGKLVDASSASDTGSTNGGLSTGIGNDQQRITYYTPRFFGFQGGISFTPSNGEDTTAFAPVDKNTTRTYAWHGAVNYVNTFGGFMVAASAGISYWPSVDGAPSTSNLDDSILDYQFGLNLGYAGFVVGGAYRRYDAGDNSINDGWAANIGVTYTTGPFAIGLSWHHSEAEGSTATSGEDKVDQVLASAAYTLGPGVDLIGSVFWIKYDDETGVDANNNEGVGVVGGVRLSF